MAQPDPRFDPILFDLDGTLVDSSRDLAAAVNRTLTRLGIATLPEPEIVGFVGDGVHRLMERTLQRAGSGGLEEALSLFKADYRQSCLVHTRAYPGIPELLTRLSGTRVGVVTNKPREFAVAVLKGLGLAGLVGAVVGGDETERIKPAPDPILLCLDRLGRTAAAGLMVGDHSNDILAGRAAGLKTCGVLWGFDSGDSVRTASPDYLCSGLSELEELLYQR